MALARRKAIENREKIQKMMSRKEPTGVVVHSADGRLFFLSSKDVRRTKISGRSRSTIKKALAKQDGSRKAAAGSMGCGKTLRWLLSHDPGSARWKKVSAWWSKNC